MARIEEDVFYIDSPADLEAELCRYNCQTEAELDELLWHNYGVAPVLTYKTDFI